MLETPPDFVKVLLNFQVERCADALMLADQYWKTNLAQSNSSIWLTLWGYCWKVCYMYLMINLITSNRWFQLWLVGSFFPQNRHREFAKKNHWSSRDFRAPRSFGLTNTFCRFKHLCLTFYLDSRQRILLWLKARNSDSNSVQPIWKLAWADTSWPECLAQWGFKCMCS